MSDILPALATAFPDLYRRAAHHADERARYFATAQALGVSDDDANTILDALTAYARTHPGWTDYRWTETTLWREARDCLNDRCWPGGSLYGDDLAARLQDRVDLMRTASRFNVDHHDLADLLASVQEQP